MRAGVSLIGALNILVALLAAGGGLVPYLRFDPNNQYRQQLDRESKAGSRSSPVTVELALGEHLQQGLVAGIGVGALLLLGGIGVIARGRWARTLCICLGVLFLLGGLVQASKVGGLDQPTVMDWAPVMVILVIGAANLMLLRAGAEFAPAAASSTRRDDDPGRRRSVGGSPHPEDEVTSQAKAACNEIARAVESLPSHPKAIQELLERAEAAQRLLVSATSRMQLMDNPGQAAALEQRQIQLAEHIEAIRARLT